MNLERRLLNILLVFALVITLGGVGYAVIEGWSWLDSLYMSITTVTAVGFDEVHPLTPAGRLFTSVLILLGVAWVTYAFTALAHYVLAGELGDIVEDFRVNQRTKSMQGHYIVCGYGRMGQEICERLHHEGQHLVVVDMSERSVDLARARGYLGIQGDVGDDEVLDRAGVLRAKGLVAVVNNDAANLYVVLSARALNPELYIVAGADTDHTVEKLSRAGADRVVPPYTLGGRLIAQTLLRPDVMDFLEVVLYDQSLQLFLEDFRVGHGCSIDALTFAKAGIRERTGANVLGIKREGNVIISPGPSTLLKPGDVLVALGTRDQLAALAELVNSPEGA